MIDIEAIRKSTRLFKRLPTEMVSQAQRNVIALLEEIDQLRGKLQQEVNGLLVENSNLRGVRDQLRQELSLAEEGLANAVQEIEQLKAERDRWKKRADELFFAEQQK